MREEPKDEDDCPSQPNVITAWVETGINRVLILAMDNDTTILIRVDEQKRWRYGKKDIRTPLKHLRDWCNDVQSAGGPVMLMLDTPDGAEFLLNAKHILKADYANEEDQ